MIALKQNNEIIGLDGIKRTWAEIEQDYLELLNPDVSNIIGVIEIIASYLFANRTTYIVNNRVQQQQIKVYLNNNTSYINTLKSIKDITNQAQVLILIDYVSENSLRDFLFNQYDICPINKISKNSLSFRLKKYKDNESFTKLAVCEQKYTKCFVIDFEKNLNAILLDKNQTFTEKSLIKGSKYPFLKDFFEEYLYEWLRGKYGYWFSNVLGIKVCPYCNNQFVLSVNKLDGNKKALYQLDHILPKSDFRYLSISLYNLIPSCASCNNAKSTKKGFLNPYTESFHHNAKFILENKKFIDISNRQSLKSTKLKLETVILTESVKVQKHIDTFCLEGIYEIHKDIVEEIYWKKGVYTKSYKKKIRKELRKFGLVNTEIDEALNRFILGNYHQEEDLHKRIHTKLTIDIAQELGLLN